MYNLTLFFIVIVGYSLKRTLDKLEHNTSVLKETALELLDKTRRIDVIINRLTQP
jgi:hypothetical protein